MKKTTTTKAPPVSRELTITERVENTLAFTNTKAHLEELAKQSADLVRITNPAGYQQIQTARVLLKNARLKVQKTGKDARDEATKYAKAVIEKEKELVGVIQPEETRLQDLQNAWDDAIEAERLAKEKADRERAAVQQSRVNAIRGMTAAVIGKGSAAIVEALAQAESMIILDEVFGDYTEAATIARFQTIESLRDLHAKVTEQERHQKEYEAQRAAEEQRIAAERAELEQLRKQQAERIAEENRVAEAERQRLAEADRAEREKQAALDKAERERKAQADQAEREAQDKARAEQQRLEDERRRQEQETLAAERKALEEEQARLEERRQAADKERTEAYLKTVTLVAAAKDARGYLIELGQAKHITTLALSAAIERHQPKPTKSKTA